MWRGSTKLGEPGKSRLCRRNLYPSRCTIERTEADRLWVERGSTVKDLAVSVHRELAQRLTGARVWGESAGQPGQRVSVEHSVADGDVVELLVR